MITAACAPRIRFRDITAEDAYLVCRWRNTPSAREVFYSQAIVTPDTHRAFVAARRPHDLIWIVEHVAPVVLLAETGSWAQPIGMLSLTVDPATRTGEYGRAYLDEAYRGCGYWRETESLLEYFAFEVLGLDLVWLDIIAANRPMIDIHLRGGWRVREEVIHDGRAALIMELDAATYRARQAAPRVAVEVSLRRDAPPYLPAPAALQLAAAERDREGWDA